MSFSNNQVRHLFVATTPKAANAAVSAVGELAPYGVTGQSLYFKHYGYGGVVSTDKIDVQNILSAKLTAGTSLNTPLFKHTVTVGTALAGQVYKLTVMAMHYVGGGDQDNTSRVAVFRAPSGATVAQIAAGLRKSLRASLGFTLDESSAEAASSDVANIDNYKEQLFTVSGTGAAVVISEVPSYWELGKFPAGRIVRVPNGAVSLGPIYDTAGVSNVSWASDVYAANGNAGDSSKKLADLEYFCMGNRGDEYRGMGYPYNITTKYQVNPTSEYDVIDIHYAYIGSNESVQKSEKDLTILVPKDNTALAQAIDTITGFAASDPRRLVAPESQGGS